MELNDRGLTDVTDKPISKRCWVVPDGFIPALAKNDANNRTGYLSHECVCLLNTGSRDVHVELTIYFEDKDPLIVNDIVLRAKRCRHMRMDELKHAGALVIQRGIPYALKVIADAPIVVQMSRLDTTQPNMAFLSTMAYPVE